MEFVTLYLTDDGWRKANDHFDELERVAGCEVAIVVGCGRLVQAINLHTTDDRIIGRARQWLGWNNVEEIAR